MRSTTLFILVIIFTFLGCQKEDAINTSNFTTEINNARSGSTSGTIAAPSNLFGTSSSISTISLTWKDNSKNETGFIIERKTGSNSFSQIASLGANITSYSDANLSEGTTYVYRVKVYKGTAFAYSNEATIQTLADITTGLVAFYPFNGNSNDASGNGNNGTNYGATLINDRFNTANSAYSFNGTSNYIQLPLLTTLDNLDKASFSFWIKSITSTEGAIIGHWGNNNGAVGINAGFVVGHYNGMIITGNYSGCCSPMSNLLTNTTSWNHIVVLFDGTKLNSERVKFYINGVESTKIVGTVNPNIGKATSSFIGRRNIDFDRYGDYFGGNLDEVRIYSRVLNLAQIAHLATH